MIVNDLNKDTLLERIKTDYRYLWAQKYDDVELVEFNPLIKLDLDEIIEARIFCEEKEIHIYNLDTLIMKETIKESQDDCYEYSQMLRKKYGKKIVLRDYVEYDQDGQAYICNTVAVSVEK